MKRKAILIVLSAILLLSATWCLTGCGNKFTVNNSEEFEKSLYKGSGTVKVTLGSDITMYTKDGFFYQEGKQEDWHLDGKGHTVTVKGDPGILGRGRSGFFARLTNCTIKNLNIVYDFNMSYSNCNFGGLATSIGGSTIDNVRITYTRPFTLTGANSCIYTGGMVGWLGAGSSLNNCSVDGDFRTQGTHMGGLAGYVSPDSSLNKCSFSGGLDHTVRIDNLTTDMRAEYVGGVGGLAGCFDGSAKSCKVELKKLYADLNCNRWSPCGIEAGGMFGRCRGEAYDCYMDVSPDADIYFHKNGFGSFKRSLTGGLLVGSLTSGARLKNVYADAGNFSASGDKFAQNDNAVSFDFGSVNTPNIDNVYLLSGEAYKWEKFTSPMVAAESDEDEYHYLIDCGDKLDIKDILIRYTVSDGVYTYKQAAFTKSEGSHSATTVCMPSSVSEDTLTTVYNDKDLVDGNYYHEVKVTLKGDETADVTVVKRHVRFGYPSKIKLVNSYGDIEFDIGENVIGGTSSGNVWTQDSATGKWIFK